MENLNMFGATDPTPPKGDGRKLSAKQLRAIKLQCDKGFNIQLSSHPIYIYIRIKRLVAKFGYQSKTWSDFMIKALKKPAPNAPGLGR